MGNKNWMETSIHQTSFQWFWKTPSFPYDIVWEVRRCFRWNMGKPISKEQHYRIDITVFAHSRLGRVEMGQSGVIFWYFLRKCFSSKMFFVVISLPSQIRKWGMVRDWKTSSFLCLFQCCIHQQSIYFFRPRVQVSILTFTEFIFEIKMIFKSDWNVQSNWWKSWTRYQRLWIWS